MESVAEILSNPVLTFLLGLIPSLIVALIIEYVKYYRSRIRSREETLEPHLWKLHTAITKILNERNALNLREKYQELQDTKINQIGTERITELKKEGNTSELEGFGDYILASLSFGLCYNSFIELIRKCNDFESEYQQMDTNGLISLLKIRQNGTYMRIADFHSYSEIVVSLTKNIGEKLKKLGEVKNEEELAYVQRTEYLNSLFSLQGSLEEIFNRAPDVEKELKKFL